MKSGQISLPGDSVKRGQPWVVMGLLALLVLLWSNGAQLKVFQVDEYYVNALRLAAVVLIGVICVVTYKRNVYREMFRNTYFKFILLLLACVIVPTFLTGVLQYGQGLDEVVRLPMFFYALFVFALLYRLWPDGRANSLIAVMVIVTTVIAGVYVAASVWPGLAGGMLADQAAIGARFGKERLSATASVNNGAVFGILYCLCVLHYKRMTIGTRIMWIGVLSVLGYYLMFVLASRARLFALLVCVVCFIFKYSSPRRLLVPIVTAGVLAVSAQLMMGGDLLAPFVHGYESLFDAGSQEADTVTVRQEGVRYYWKLFTESGYVGIGMVSPTRAEATDAGYAMSKLSYNPSDLGLIAVLLFYGLPGIAVTLYIAFRIWCDTTTILRFGSQDDRIVAMTIKLYLLFYFASFYHVFLYPEYALEWGVLFFAISHLVRQRGENVFLAAAGGMHAAAHGRFQGIGCRP